MKSTRKAGLEPVVQVAHGLTPELVAIFEAWPARFRTKVAIGDGCWQWIACTVATGYGRFSRSGGVALAHRHGYELTHGPLTSDVHIDHLCRNHGCVRPDHLEAVTHAVNVRRGRQANVAGWCRSGRHEWVEANILVELDGARRCRPCRDERESAYRPAAGNAPDERTHCPQGHEYTPENTRVRAKGYRECRTCHRERARAAYHAQKATA